MERAWFSNFYKLDKPMIYQGLSFPTVEHFYVAMKTKDFNIRKQISLLSTPGKAKRFGRDLNLRSDWNEIKLDVMEYALKFKFAPGTTWYIHLIISSDELVEWNLWHDKFWGKCVCSSCQGKGENHLGKILMKLRSICLLNERS